MKLDVKATAKGYFKNVEVLRPNGSVRVETGEFENLITDAGISRLYSTNLIHSAFSYMKASSDNTEPSESDTTISGLLGSVSDSGDGTHFRNVDEGYVSKTYVWTFPVGSVVGNVSKLATGWSGGEANNFSIALVKDAGGNPTTLTIQADEQLRVTWEIRLYWPTEDVTGTLINEGNKGGTFNYTVRPAFVSGGTLEPWAIGGRDRTSLYVSNVVSLGPQGHYTILYMGETTLGPLNGEPTSVGGAVAQGAFTALSSAFPAAKGTFALTAPQGNNSLGIGGMRFGTGSQAHRGIGTCWQVKFDPPIPKTALDALEIDVQVSVARHGG